MRAAGHAAQVGLYGLAPAAHHAGAHHGLQGALGFGAAGQRVGIHGGFDGAHDQVAVHRDAQPHVVNRITRGAQLSGVAQRGQVVGLAVVQFALYVPQAIVTFEALVVDAADMSGGAGGGG